MIIFFKSTYLFEKKKERQVEVKTEQRVAMKTLRGDCCFRITREVHHFFFAKTHQLEINMLGLSST